MKQTRTIPVQGLVILLTILAVCGISGRLAWKAPQYAVGQYTLAENPWGTALFQDGLHSSLQINGYKESSLEGTTVTFTKPENTQTTIDYSRDDIIFDNEGNLYTESKINEIDTISTLSGISLKKVQTLNRLAVIAPSFLYVINPHIPGVLAIQIPSISTVNVNLERKSITIPETVHTIVIHVYKTIPVFTEYL